jgi:holliday junction resolvase YEN1
MPQIGLTYQDLILVALFSGGDYDNGIEGCGVGAAVGLARAGFGSSLVAKVQSLALRVQHAENKRTKVTLSGPERRELDTFLDSWRAEVTHELRTNSRKLLGKRNNRAAASMQAMGGAFPNVDVLMAYINPVTSEERAVAKAVRANPRASGATLAAIVRKVKDDIAQSLRSSIIWPRDPSIAEIARLVEDKFEWGYKERMIQRFSNWLWEGIVCRHLRRQAIIRDLGESRFFVLCLYINNR